MLYVHRSERADRLAEVLASVLGTPLPDPMAPEVVAVPTRGVERWLTQTLSHRLGCSPDRHDGVAANIEFPFPGSLVGAAVAKATGVDHRWDPWVPERAVCALLEVIDANLEDPELKPLAEHLVAASPTSTDGSLDRFPTARHLADLYDQYGVHRPELVRGWAAGDPGAFENLGRNRWQARLWVLLRQWIGVTSPAERLELAVERLSTDPGLLELPGRLSLFGLTRLPPSYLAVLQALAAAREVHLFLLHPSGVLWDTIANALRDTSPGFWRKEDTTGSLALNGLLRSWGRDAGEMQLVLAAHGAAEGEYRAVDDDVSEPSTLLGRLQRDIRRNIAVPPPGPAGDGRPVLGLSDTSVRLHSCHGRYRQVEVLREAVLHLLADDPTIEARDVIVMCPDVETFAPLIEAVFGSATTGHDESAGPIAEDPGQELRVKLADRSLRQTNPLLGVTAVLLELANSRVTASQVIDLAGRDPVRRRFGFDDEELAQIERWVVEMGARWGFDADHRAEWKLPGLRENTWEFGLDRLLLGVVMAEDGNQLFGGSLPLDDVAGSSVDLAGRFAEFISRLGSSLRNLSRRQQISAWCIHLADATDRIAMAAPTEAWQATQMRRLLDEAVLESAAGEAEVTLPEVRALLAHRLRGRPTRANFRTGDLTVCTLVPMRSVPHRVVCLLGLDDGVFPRHPEHDGDDLIATDPQVGDRNARSEDRQLLLDALLAASDHLVITYSGRDERTNHARPPAVPIAELLDAIDRTVSPPDGFTKARDAVVVQHPLQAFDPRNFTPGNLRPDGPWGFGKLELAGARSLVGGARCHQPFLECPLPEPNLEVFNLEALVRFFKNPVRSFLRERLGVFVAGDIGGGGDETADSMPIELDGLEKWAIGDRILRARVRGTPTEQVVETERARGLLPPRHLADEALDDILSTAERSVEWLESLVPGVTGASAGGLETIEINVALPSGRRLLGMVPGVHQATVVNVLYSRLGPKHRVEAWIRLLAFERVPAGLAASAVTVARSPVSSDPRPVASVIGGLSADPDERARAALTELDRLIELYERGMTEPLPLYCCTSLAWAQAQRGGGDAFGAASAEWEGGYFRSGERGEDSHRLVLGDDQSFNALLAEPPRPEESGSGWDGRETSRFGRLARRFWDPLLDHEMIRFP